MSSPKEIAREALAAVEGDGVAYANRVRWSQVKLDTYVDAILSALEREGYEVKSSYVRIVSELAKRDAAPTYGSSPEKQESPPPE